MTTAQQPIVDVTETHVLLKCRRGHLIASSRLRDWAGSPLESKASQPMSCSCCKGA